LLKTYPVGNEEWLKATAIEMKRYKMKRYEIFEMEK